MPQFLWLKWIKKTFNNQPGRRKERKPLSQGPRRVVLNVENLEERIVPSTGLQPLPNVTQPHDNATGLVVSVEGQTVKAAPLLQFVDTTGPTDLGNLTATIHWGDGTPDTIVTSSSLSTATITNPGAGNNFEVDALASGAHVYDEAPPGTNFTVSVTALPLNPLGDSPATTGAGTPLTGAVPSGVADAALTDTTIAQGTVNGTEGNAFTNVVLATFDDANPNATAADFPVGNITVTYTGAPTIVGTPAYAVQSNGGPTLGFSHWKVVATSVTFAEKGNYQAKATVADVGGQTVGPTANGPTFAVADGALTDTTPLASTVNAVEGNAISNLVLATFDDANPNATVADFPVGNITVTYTGAPTFTVAPTYAVQANGAATLGVSHWKVVLVSGTVAEKGNYVATVGVTDTDLATVSDSNTTLVVADGALTDTTPPASTVNAIEGNAINNLVLATFDDANQNATAADFPVGNITVTYTGTPTFTVAPVYAVQTNGAPSGGVSHWKVVLVSGTVAEKGNYVATVTVTDTDGLSVNDSNTTLAVADGALIDTTAAQGTVNGTEGNAFTNVVLATFDDANPNATAADFPVGNITVTYTGGATIVGVPAYAVQSNGAPTLGFSHWKVVATSVTFAEKGNYQAAATVTDTDLASVGPTANGPTFAVADGALIDTTAAQGTVNGTEGNAFTNVVLATFDDANPNATAADFPVGNITVTYTGAPTIVGTPAYAVQSNGAPTLGFSHWEVVATSVTFAEKGNYQAAATVTDTDLASVGPTANGPTFAVADGALTDTTPPASTVNAVEGNAISNLVLATFDDANPNATAADFPAGNITVTYTNAPVFTVAPTYAVQANGAPTLGVSHWKVVLVSGTVREEGNYVATVSVTDVDGNNVTTSNTTLAVSDPAVNPVIAGPTINAVEGSSTNAVLLATFSDPGDPTATVEPLTDYKASVTWGDTPATTFDSVANPSVIFLVRTGTQIQVFGTHGYTEESPALGYTVTTTITHDTSLPVTGIVSTQKAIVTDALLTNLTINPVVGISENGSTAPQVLATFTDSGGAEPNVNDPGGTTDSRYVTVINWGDGTTSDNLTLAGGVTVTQVPATNNFQVNAPAHQYTEEGTYTVNVTITHELLSPVSTPTTPVTVGEVAVAVTPAAANSFVASEGVASAVQPVATFTDPAGADAISEYSALINWNDTTAPVAGTITVVGTTFTVSGSHTYAEEGAQTATVTVTHNGTSTTGAAMAITVLETAVSATGGFTVTAVEGAAAGAAQTVATFTDPAGAEVTGVVPNANEYSAVVTWAGGSTSPGTITFNAGVFTVTAAPTATAMAEDGSYAFSVAINHPTAALSATVAGTLTVSDAALTAGPITPPVGATENVATTLATLLHFTDADPAAAVGDYTAVINWGDATPNTTVTSTAAGDGSVISVSGAGFDVKSLHQYAEEGTFPITITVTDLGGATTSASGAVTVGEVAVAVTPAAANSFVASEGVASAVQPVATFTDPAGADAISEYSALINWNDTTAPVAGTITVVGTTFTVSGSHTYAEEGAQTATVTVTHNGTTTTGVAMAITVLETAVSATGGFTVTAVEGAAPGAAQTVATFTDPAGAEVTGVVPNAGEYSALVTWAGGSTSAGTITFNAGVFTVTATPTAAAVAEEGSTAFSVAINHPTATPSATVAGTLAVSDAALTAGPITPPVGATENVATTLTTLLHFTDADPAAAVGDYTAVINWGDATPNTTVTSVAAGDGSVISVSGAGFDVKSLHQYAEEGTFPITITVTDAGGATTSASGAVTVGEVAVAVTPAAANSFVASEGVASAVQPVATFTDPAGADAINEYSALINWNDATAPVAGTITVVGSTFTVSGSHTYAEEGAQTATVTVTHNGTTTTGVAMAITVLETAVSATGGFTVTAVEGAAPGAAQTVATFTDPAGAEVTGVIPNAGEYSALVTWAGGSTSAGTITFNAGVFTVTATPTAAAVAEEGSTAFSVAINHPTATPSATVAGTLAVSDAALTAGPITPPVGATENVATTLTTLLHFTDADPAAAVGDYTAVINWGDATPNTTVTSVAAGDGSVISVSGAGFDVKSLHQYAEEGTFPITITVTDAGGATTSASGAVTVGEVAVAVTPAAANSFVASEGVASAVQPVATFTDPAGADAINEYSALINWNDATAPVAGTITVVGSTFTVSGSHTYAEEGAQTATVTVTHNGTSTTGVAMAITVLETAVSATGGFTITAVEGAVPGVAQTVATFTDPAGAEVTGVIPNAGEYSALVTWAGGSTSAGTITYNAGVFTVTATPTAGAVAEDGSYAFSVAINHPTLLPTTVTVAGTLTVSDAALTAGPVTPPVGATENVATTLATLLHFTDADAGGVASDYTAVINWGDTTPNTTVTSVAAGNGSVISVSGAGFDVKSLHQYAEEGTFPITITVTDAGGATTSASGAVTVGEVTVAVTPAAANSFVASEGVASAVQPVATFTDPAGADAINEYSALINWNDGSAPVAGTITVVGTTFTVSGSHTYAEEGAQTATVTVTHNGTSTTGVAMAITVLETAVSATGGFTVTAVEGAAAGVAQTVATFTDPAGAESTGTPSNEYSALVTWAGGSTSAGTITFNAGVFTVTAAPTATAMAEDGSYAFSVAINHPTATPSATVAGTLAVSDAALTTLATAAMPTGKVEGTAIGTITGIASFTDPAGIGAETVASLTDFVATINWGDGTTISGTVVQGVGGNYTVDAPTHTYVDEGNYTVNVTIKHDALPPVITPNQTISIAEVQITNLTAVITNQKINPGGSSTATIVANFTDPAGAEPVADYTASIDYGDNFVVPGIITNAGGNNFQATAAPHTYNSPGNYTVKVTVKHETAAALTVTVGVNTVAVPLTDPISGHHDTSTVVALNSLIPSPTGTVTYSASLHDPLFDIKQQFGLTAPEESVSFGLRGMSEKYFKSTNGSNAANGGYYVLLPDGKLYAWDGNSLPTTIAQAAVATVDDEVYYNPALITSNTGVPIATSGTNPLYDLKLKYGLANPAGAFNFRGSNELYIRSSNGSNAANGGWFVLEPNDGLYLWDGTGLAAPLVADLTPYGNVYANPTLLTGATLPIGTAVTDQVDQNGFVTLIPTVGFDRTILVTVTATDDVHTNSRTVHYQVDNSAPTVPTTSSQSSVHSAGGVSVALGAGDPGDPAPLIYSVNVSDPLYDLQTQLGLASAASAFNFRNANEWYFLSSNGSNSAGQGYYVLLPNGRLYAFDIRDLNRSDLTNTLNGSFTDLSAYAVYKNPGLITYASPAPTVLVNRGPLFDIQAQFGLTTPARAFNFRGQHEWYFQSTNGSNPVGLGYFVLFPNGDLKAFDIQDLNRATLTSTSGEPSLVNLAVYGVYADPSLLSSAQPAFVGDPIYALKYKFGLTTAAVAFNFRGQNEWYFHSINGSNPAGLGFYVLQQTTGNLYSFDIADLNSTTSLANTFTPAHLVGTTSLAVYNNPSLLSASTGRVAVVTATVDTTGQVTLTPNPAFAGTVNINTTVSDGADQTTKSFAYAVTNAAPSLPSIVGPSAPASTGAIGVTIPLGATDPNPGDLNTLQFAASVTTLFDIRTQFGLTAADITGAANYRLAGEKYFLSSNGSNPTGLNYFVLMPDNRLYAFNNNDLNNQNLNSTLAGAPVANLSGFGGVYANTTLLYNATAPGVSTTITNQSAGGTLKVTWSPSLPAGTIFKVTVYVGDAASETQQTFFITLTP